MAKTFRAVTVTTLSNNGQSTPKYNKPVMLSINYDPQGLSIELVSGKGTRRYAVLLHCTVTFDGNAADGATRLIDHATDRDSGNITTLRVRFSAESGEPPLPRFATARSPPRRRDLVALSRSFSLSLSFSLVLSLSLGRSLTLALVPRYCHRATHANNFSD